MGLRRLVYVSRAAPGISALDVEAILAAAHARNTRSGVTGLLLFDGRSFLQYLEGEAGALQAIFASIRSDERHEDVVVLLDEAAEAKVFDEWSMGLLHVAGGFAPRGRHGAEGLSAQALADRLPEALPGDVRILIITFACGAYEPAMSRHFS